MSKVLGIDHIAVAVEDLDAAARHWSEVLGLRLGGREIVEDQGVEVQMLYAGDTRVELICPIHDESPVRRYLDKRGPGMHHLAIAVEDCADSLATLKDSETRLIDQEPRAGAHNTRIAFLHPAAANGVLTELVEGGEGPWQEDTAARQDDESGQGAATQP